MNSQLDIIVIGDSKEGNTVVKNIASANKSIKIAFISREFKNNTTHDFLSVEYIKDEVTFTDYKNRLFGCYLKSGARLYATHLIFAVGQKYAPLVVNNKKVPNVFNTAEDIPKEAKDLPTIVIGHRDVDVKLALAVAKKYKYVYLCSDTFKLDCTENMLKKLTTTKNIVLLPNTKLVGISTANGALKSVELDNYSSVTCSAIYAKTAVSSDTGCVSNKLIKNNEDGYLETDSKLESTLVPKCFAVGSCTQKYTKKMLNALIEAILIDFGGI